jgi:antitoxin VapB
MAVLKTRTLRSGNSEAVRLPNDIAFCPDVEVTMGRSGDVLTIYPTRSSSEALIDT